MRRLILAAVIWLGVVVPAAANEYRAERFDSRVEILPGGSLRVTETIVFRFEKGTFKKVFRVIPTRRTDGVDFVSASMDGVDFPVGSGNGHVSVRRNKGLRVEWHFPPTSETTHTFVMSYVARGVATTEERADVVAWRALPTEHNYRIDSSTIEILLPAAAIDLPEVRVRRVGGWDTGLQPSGVAVTARDIGKNGWLEVSVPLTKGTVVTASPEWQQRSARYESYRNPALVAGAVVLFGAVVLLFGLRQGYDSPPPDISAPTLFDGPPDPLPPALAGAVGANGTPKSEHAFATLFALAERGVVTVEEEPGVWGTRAFRLTRNRGTALLKPHEQTLLDTVFRGKAEAEGYVTLRKAQSNITTRFSAFRHAVIGELADAGLLDPGRRRVRKNYQAVGVALLLLGPIGMAVVAGVLLQRYGPWMFVVPGAIFVAGIMCLIAGSAHTALSNEGVRRSAAWRAYRKYLRATPSDGIRHDPRHSPTTLLPYAVALGLGPVWSKLFKNRTAELPEWFRAASAADAHRAFVAFVGVGGAPGGHGGGAVGGGGGGAAGGGASGAG
jgi:hypothetical protein